MPKREIDKTYDPTAIETRLYKEWEKAGCFTPSGKGAPYTIVIPPPNVTGSLHMGHALNNTLQDILCRFERMRGRDVLWQVGTDHAGIATQMVVERQLAEEGNITRRDMGRAAFIERVWAWKQESGGTITQQLRRLGASCDWRRERFTMDEGLSAAVVKVFVALYKDKLIYKDKRLVNWDPGLMTAISDLEVVQKEVDGALWHFTYPLAEGKGGITIATTRPETMLADTGVAVHPDDPRYQALIGQQVIVPIVGRAIPIVADEHADPEQGTGAVKITPAHDFNDFEVGQRCGLAAINMLDQRAHLDLSDPAFDAMPARAEWHGLERFAARQRVVAEMEALGALVKVEQHRHIVPFGDRSDQIIEPWLTDQWYVAAEKLAAKAIEKVKKGKTQFFPENWQKTYFDWLENIQPWCISRQLWWGHQIPAWYDEDGKVYVAHDEEEAYEKYKKDGGTGKLTRDDDVLDTWFSSALWPFSTLGWPEEQNPPRYPTSVLVTGFDIIFFWVARMMMLGLHFLEDVPFERVYVHALVRDEKGAKMSKSKGNVIDPLDLIDRYGADALRFTLAAMASPGRDIKLAEKRVEGYRNFGTKLWNAARFCAMNGCFADAVAAFEPKQAKTPLAQWLVSEVAQAQVEISKQLDAYRFDAAADAAYRFIWGSFCDWYVELAKPDLQGAQADEIRAATRWGFEQALRLLHPFMPFVTEELWQKTAQRAGFLMQEQWPELPSNLAEAEGVVETKRIIEAVQEIREVKHKLELPNNTAVHYQPSESGEERPSTEPSLNYTAQEIYPRNISKVAREKIAELARVQLVDSDAGMNRPFVILMKLGFLTFDFMGQGEKIGGKIAELEKEVTMFTKKLANKDFTAKAPPEIVAETQEKLQAAQKELEKWQNIQRVIGEG